MADGNVTVLMYYAMQNQRIYESNTINDYLDSVFLCKPGHSGKFKLLILDIFYRFRNNILLHGKARKEILS